MSHSLPLTHVLQIPRTPSWSLTELHHKGDDRNEAHHVLTEAKVCPLCALWMNTASNDRVVKLRELAELCHLQINDATLPALLKDVESIIQCTKTIQAMTLDADIDELYAQGDSHAGAFVSTHATVCEEGSDW